MSAKTISRGYGVLMPGAQDFLTWETSENEILAIGPSPK